MSSSPGCDGTSAPVALDVACAVTVTMSPATAGFFDRLTTTSTCRVCAAGPLPLPFGAEADASACEDVGAVGDVPWPHPAASVPNMKAAMAGVVPYRASVLMENPPR